MIQNFEGVWLGGFGSACPLMSHQGVGQGYSQAKVWLRLETCLQVRPGGAGCWQEASGPLPKAVWVYSVYGNWLSPLSTATGPRNDCGRHGVSHGRPLQSFTSFHGVLLVAQVCPANCGRGLHKGCIRAHAGSCHEGWLPQSPINLFINALCGDKMHLGLDTS